MLSKLALWSLLLASLALPISARTWTDASGRQFSATLIRKEGEKVLLNVGGRQRSFQLSQLSSADQTFLSTGAESSTSSSPGRTTTSKRVDPTRRPRPTSVQIHADVSIKVERLRADPVNKRWVYGSPNFEFVCDEDLGLPAVRKFAWMFEAVWQFCARMPFDIPRLRAQQKVRMKTYLIKEEKDYIRQGGLPNSGGVYISTQDVILVPFSSLDLSKGSSRTDTNLVLRHEVTHQLMHGQSQQAAWFIEGAAEYVAAIPYEQNRLLTDRHLQGVRAYVTAFGWNKQMGRNLGKNITFAPLEGFMKSSYQQFQNTENSYAYALVLYTYFARLDGQKDGARLARYVAALQDGRSEFEARELLLDGRSYQQLQKDLAVGWGSLGVALKFK